MFCSECGNKEVGGARYCANCGADLSPQCRTRGSSDGTRQAGQMDVGESLMQETQKKILSEAVGGLAGILLPVKTFRDFIKVAAPAEAVLRSASQNLQGSECLTDRFTCGSPGMRLSFLVRSGVLKLNPTIIHVEVNSHSQSSSRVTITAAAKEGLVNQHSAEKAVAQLKEALMSAYGIQTPSADAG